jgi:hypothetical protein
MNNKQVIEDWRLLVNSWRKTHDEQTQIKVARMQFLGITKIRAETLTTIPQLLPRARALHRYWPIDWPREWWLVRLLCRLVDRVFAPFDILKAKYEVRLDKTDNHWNEYK